MVHFLNTDFHTEHEAICAALFKKYGWEWERNKHPKEGWQPDFLLKGHTQVWVECKGGLKWDDVSDFPEYHRYQDAVSGSSDEVLLIPESPKIMKNPKGYDVNILGLLYDGQLWSYAELGRWSGKVGFCHSAHSWRDRMSGEDVDKSSGDGRSPNIENDWRAATQNVKGKKVTFFQGFVNSPVEEWDTRD